MGVFDKLLNTTAQPTSTPAPSGGTFDHLLSDTPKPAVTSTFDKVAPKTPYFYGTTPQGGTIGASDQKDVSGVPFVGYRNPNDTSTTTDKTRVATTFDPRVPQPLDLHTFLNSRMSQGASAQLKKTMGGAYSDELDHKIALELSGSNDPSNLQVQPGLKGGAAAKSDQVENQLAQDVVSGKKSLFQAQTELAQQKGLPTPWVGDSAHPANKTPDALFNKFDQKSSGPTPASVISNALKGFVQEPEGDAAKSTAKQFQYALSENLPIIGPLVKDIRNNPENYTDMSVKDVTKNLPSAGVETGQAYVKAPIDFILSAATAPTGKQINVSIPGLGQLSNAEFRTAQRINNGEDPTAVALSEGSGEVFNGLFLLGLINTITAPRPTVVAQGEAPGITTVDEGPKSFREYKPPTFTQPISPEFIAKMKEQGAVIGDQYNPQLPTYFRMVGNGKSPTVGEIVQLKPSYLSQFGDLFKSSETTPATSPTLMLGGKSMTIDQIHQEMSASDFEKLSPEDQQAVANFDHAHSAVSRETKTGITTVPIEEIKPEVRYSHLGMKPEPVDLNETPDPSLVSAIKSGQHIEPIPVEVTPEGGYRLLGDGGTRYIAYRAAGVTDIPVDIKGATDNAVTEQPQSLSTPKNLDSIPDTAITPVYSKSLTQSQIQSATTNIGSQTESNNLTSAEKKTINSFDKSNGQKVVGTIKNEPVVIGDYGENAIARKTAAGQEDRLPSSEIARTTKYITDQYQAGDSGFRKDNIISVAKMPNGEYRAIITRINPSGKNEVINFFKIGRDITKFTENLKAFGTPGENRTPNALIRKQGAAPSNGDISTLPVDGKPVKDLQNKYKPFTPGPKISTETAINLIKDRFPDANRNFIFDPQLLKETGATGQFYSKEQLFSDKLRPIIRLYEKKGMVYIRTMYHELGHYLESLMSPSELKALNEATAAIMTPKDFKYYRDQGYTTKEEQMSEFRQDNFGKEEADKAGFKSKWQKVVDIINGFLKKISDTAKALFERMKNTPNKQGGFVNFFGNEEEGGLIESNNNESDQANAENNKLEAKAARENKPTTPAERHLEELLTQREAIQETVNNHPAKPAMKYMGPNGLAEVTGEGGKFATSGDEYAQQLGFSSSEELRNVGVPDYQLQQKRLDAINSEITQARKQVAENRKEDKNAKSLNSLLNKTANKTDTDITRQLHKEALQKAEAKAAAKLADEQAYREQLDKNLQKAVAEGAPKEGVAKQIARALDPVGHLRPETKTVVQKWLAHRISADILAREEINKYPEHNREGMNTIVAQQDGAKIPWLTTAFENLWTEGNRRGLDIGHQENYMPQVWKESREDIHAILEARMKAQGLDKAEIQAYLDGKQVLDPATAARLKLNPSFSKQKVVPDYRTGMAMGLHPKYQNPVQLIANYRRDMERAIANRDLRENLKKNGDLLAVDLNAHTKPARWDITEVFGRPYFAPRPLAKFLNDYLRNDNDLTWQQTLSKNFATGTHIMQNIVLLGGIPGTTLQSFPLSMLYAETLGYGNFKAFKPWLIANSDKLTQNFVESHWKYIKMMGEDGVPVNGLASGDWNKESLGSIIKATNILSVSDLRHLGGELWDRGWQSKVYDRMIPMLSVQIYKAVYDGQLAKGASEDMARKLASDTVKNKYAFRQPQGKTTQDILRSAAFGPVWRQQILKTLWNGGKGWSSEFNNPAFKETRKLVVGILLTFLAYQLLNKKMNGKYTWENGTGHELDLAIPHSDGSQSFLTFFPSYMTLPRLAVGATHGLATGDIKGAAHQGYQTLSRPLQVVGDVLTNTDYFGRAIYKPGDSTATRYSKMAEYVGGQAVLPPFVGSAINYAQSKDTSLQLLTSLTNGIMKYQTSTAANSSDFYNATAATTAANSKAMTDFQPTYDKIQQLVKDGRATEAQAAVDKLSDDDYKIYQKIKSNEARTATIKNEINILPTVKKVQALIKAGKLDEAQALVSGLSDADYKAYNLAKKRYGIQ